MVFFATTHRKGAYDGLAGTINHFAYRASLQLKTREKILSAFQTYQWISQSINNADFIYMDNEMYNKTMKFLNTRLFRAVRIKRT